MTVLPPDIQRLLRQAESLDNAIHQAEAVEDARRRRTLQRRMAQCRKRLGFAIRKLDRRAEVSVSIGHVYRRQATEARERWSYFYMGRKGSWE